ncbi:MAG: zinc-binding dehydrogenase [Acidimicrobiales bacterium]
MRALQFRRQEVRYVAAAVGSRLFGSDGAKVGPLKLVDTDPPALPGPGWVRVRPVLSGICGSDLATVSGAAARYFEPFISFPFTLGHEVIGEIVGEEGQIERVVLEPVLGPEARGFVPPWPGASPGDGDDYGHLITGELEPGIQIGYCASTGGGWSGEFVAHRSQLHPIPDTMSDETAVMIEPLAVALHAVCRARLAAGSTVAVLGAGTMGLLCVAALRALQPDCRILVGAKYRHQQELARRMGADQVVEPDALPRAVRRAVGCHVIGEDLAGGADATIDTLGSSATIRRSIGITRPRGRVVLVGMPAGVRLELTAMWHRETELVGAYCYCTETLAGGERRSTFSLAIDLASKLGDQLGSLVSASYPLERYVEAIAHAANAGPRASVKVCFDLRTEKRR